MLPGQCGHAVDELQLGRAAGLLIQHGRMPEHRAEMAHHLIGKPGIARADGQAHAIARRAGTFGQVEAQQGEQGGVHGQFARRAQARVVLGGEGEVVTACEPLHVA